MTVAIGSRLGPYEILAAVGAGGMGEVYRARDTRLDRTVAIKVLPASVSSNPAFRERFEREARTISSLSHPHICALFDVGHQDGLDYLVMEFLDGETVATRLAKGPLPTEQVLRYGVEIAEALYAAHKHGIVHRDLKPANIALTKSGAKLLDFGLAKGGGLQSSGAPGDATHQKPLTEEGTLLGTFQYMAPEQLEGQEADPRTDIFAFGAVLYEMATGKRAFEGKSKASLIASILDRDPVPITQIQPLTPPALERVIRICLAKDPDDRWQSAHDIAAELRWIAEGTSAAYGGRPARAIPRRWLWGAMGVIAGVAIGAAATWIGLRDRTPTAPVSRFTIPLPPAAPLFYGSATAVAISPDGTRIVYRAKDGEDTHLYTRSISQLVPTLIPGTTNAIMAAFSPDGRSIAFQDEGRLQKVSLDGGLPVFLTSASGGASLGIRWVGNAIYYNRDFAGGIWMVAADGGTPKQVVKVDPAKGARAVVWPDVLPDGTILATVWNNGTWDDSKLVAYPAGSSAPKVVIDGGTCAHYVPTGHLLFERGGSLYGVAFDAKKLMVTSAPFPLISGVATGVTNGEAHYAVSDTGTLLYVPGGVLENKRSLLWVDRRGNETPVVTTQRPYGALAISPDRRTIAVSLETSTFDIWQLDVERDSLTRVSYGGDDSAPTWTHDGSRIIWSSSRSGHNNLYWAAADNSSGEQRLTNSDREQFVNGISPDGRLLAITESGNPETGFDIVLMAMTGDHKTQPLLASRFNERDAKFSPDGKWMTYTSDESGRREAYLRPFPGPGGKWPVSVGGADGAMFSNNGREIIFRSGPKFFAAPIETQPQVRIGKPQLLFEKVHREAGWAILPGGWDISNDDQRILLVRNEAPPTTTSMQIVLNWFSELKRRVPTR
ncbi:MAG: serine/threonine-protein kinase [Acidobacteriota bacterium]|nr:serine/threonine-protein kinase [Acidobacteriota bacterium]